MDIWERIVPAAVVPVVIMSACGLLCSAFYARMAAVVSRLRTFQRDQLQEQEYILKDREARSNPVLVERHRDLLNLRKQQIARTIDRVRLIRRTLICLLVTIGLLIFTSLASGLSVVIPATMYAAAPLFFLAMSSLLAGIICALRELRASLDLVELEDRLIREIAVDFEKALEEKK